MSSKSISELAGAKIYYHTGVFSGKAKAALAIVGFAGLTALAVATLAYLHVLKIPSQAMYGIAGGSGAFFLAALIAIIVLNKKHNAQSLPLKYYLNEHPSDWWEGAFKELQEKSSCDRYSLYNGQYEGLNDTQHYLSFMLRISENNARSIHLFLNDDLETAYKNSIKSTEF